MDPAQLAELEHENWLSYLSASISFSPSGQLLHDRGIASLLSGTPMRFYNQILVEDETATAAAIRHGVELARSRGDQFVVNLRQGIDDRFVPTVEALGLIRPDDALTPGMSLYPAGQRNRAAQPGGRFEIRRVTDEAGLTDHVRTVTAGFGAHESVAAAVMPNGLLARRESTVYVGYLDGMPVTSGLGWRSGRTIGVYNISTVQGARRHGYGEAMTARVVADGHAAGCDVAALQASDMARPIYERLGFRVVVQYRGYVDAATGAGGRSQTPGGG